VRETEKGREEGREEGREGGQGREGRKEEGRPSPQVARKPKNLRGQDCMH
jgi:hypothetical protein